MQKTSEIVPRKRIQLDFNQDNPKSVSLTEQNHRAECDINNIVHQYTKTGNIQHLNKHEAQYGDYTSTSFREAQEIIATANTMFEELPSATRNKFENNPEKFLDFVQDKDNHQEMYEMGLTHNPPEPEVQPAVQPAEIAKKKPEAETT